MLKSWPMKNTVSERSTVVAAKDQVSSDLRGEVAILHLGTGMYYGLDEVGARIWELIQEPRTVDEVRGVLLSEYDVDSERCERDLLGLLERLKDAGLVEVWS
jgi:Coenzyme PQQ synthesis protein D (PqqD)